MRRERLVAEAEEEVLAMGGFEQKAEWAIEIP
jgi:hypothetical protein